MATRYFTKVSTDLLGALRRHADLLPEGFKLIREIAAVAGHEGWVLVEFEDAGAPADLEGCMVTPTISYEWETPERYRLWISNRYVDGRGR